MITRILAAVFLLLAATARADSWLLPQTMTLDSSDGQWRLTVVPKRLESQLAYFGDKVDGVDDAGALQTMADNRARAELYQKEAHGTWQLAARWALVNEVAPVSAIVANDGTVITFDNWHSMGYGDDVVVIYRANGELVRKLGLDDFMEEEDIGQLRRSVSSIWWSGKHRLDEEKRQLVLQVDAHKMEEVPLSLETGEVLVPKRLTFPPPKVTWAADELLAVTCEGALSVSAEELTQRVVNAAVPAYPALARKARFAGSVILEIIIDEQGAVNRIHMLKPLPFGLSDAARNAVMTWRFRPLELDGKRRAMCGHLTMTFDLTGSQPARP